MNYLHPSTDPHSLVFQDYPIRINPNLEKYVPCRVCQGHGGWNLTVNAYSLRGHLDTPQNRHHFCHFRSMCGQCDGYGYVLIDSLNSSCIHDYKELSSIECSELKITHYGMCWHVLQCKHCKQIKSYDSSD